MHAGGFSWASFKNGGTLAGPPFSPAQCSSYMRSVACHSDSVLQKSVLFYGFPRGDYPPFHVPTAEEMQTATAAFMLIRGPRAYLGYSWVSCSGDCLQWMKASYKSNPAGYCPKYGHGGAPVQYALPPNRNDDFGVPMETCHEVGWSRCTLLTAVAAKGKTLPPLEERNALIQNPPPSWALPGLRTKTDDTHPRNTKHTAVLFRVCHISCSTCC